MKDNERRAIESALQKAIEAETAGEHFYRMAAKSTRDAKGREVFERLADEEKCHFEYLRDACRSVREGGSIGVQVGKAAALDAEDPIFSPELRRRIGEAHYEMSALSVGIQLELNARNFYKESADRAADAGVRAFFAELARWETVHYEGLLRQNEALKEGYWAEAGFAPI